EPVFIAEADRGLYHAALAGAANHLVTQVVQATDLLTKAGVAQPARMHGPLLSTALDNALRLGDAALSAPGARGEAVTGAEERYVQLWGGSCGCAPRNAPRSPPSLSRAAKADGDQGDGERDAARARRSAAAGRTRRGTPVTALRQTEAPGRTGPPVPMLIRTR